MKNSGYKNVVIIGSGVAYGLGNIPIQAAFWKELKKFINGRCESNVYEHLKTELKEESIFEGRTKSFSHDKIEIQFSKLHDLFYSKNVSTRVRSATLRLMIFIRKEIVAWLSNNKDFKKVLLNFTPKKNDWKADNTVFLSFNYDEIFEDQFLKKENYIHYKFEDPSGISDKFLVLKPHGSVTWMEKRYRSDNIIFKSYRPAQFERFGWEDLEKLKTHPADAIYFMKDNNLDFAYTPVIIPFYHQKRDWFSSPKWGGILGEIFFKFVESLAGCENLWIIGYGLPKADWTVAEALCSLRGINIHIVSPQKRSNCGWREKKPACYCSRRTSNYIDKTADLYQFLSKNKLLKIKVIDQCAFKFFKGPLQGEQKNKSENFYRG